MKKLVLLIILLGSLFSCSINNNLTTQGLIGISARSIACQVKKSGALELQYAIENAYLSLKAGTLTPEAIQQLSEYTKQWPTLAADITDLMSLVGVNLTNLTQVQIAPEIYTKVEQSWQQGLLLCTK